jgi:hypothetical protein
MPNPFDNLPPELLRLVAVPPHPWVLAVAEKNLNFQSAMLSLASCAACDLSAVTEAFKRFAASRPWPWRNAVIYCRAYFVERGRFPFDIEALVAGDCGSSELSDLGVDRGETLNDSLYADRSHRSDGAADTIRYRGPTENGERYEP